MALPTTHDAACTGRRRSAGPPPETGAQIPVSARVRAWPPVGAGGVQAAGRRYRGGGIEDSVWLEVITRR